ncbi:hypothetical protein ACIA33_05295 [Lactobacillus delbrueckii subsp. bulgaricus]
MAFAKKKLVFTVTALAAAGTLVLYQFNVQVLHLSRVLEGCLFNKV